MNKSLDIIQKDPFPICVTEALDRNDPDLKRWEQHFQRQGIMYKFKDAGNGKVYLKRAVTEGEIEEIKQGKWIIRGSSFKTPAKKDVPFLESRTSTNIRYS